TNKPVADAKGGTEALIALSCESRAEVDDLVARAHCRAICGEMHSGFAAMRAALPMNLKGHFPGLKVWSRAQADIDRIVTIWTECLT
ncbi:glutathione S-transferase, partial [Burkholderia sp. SIMBA_042]